MDQIFKYLIHLLDDSIPHKKRNLKIILFNVTIDISELFFNEKNLIIRIYF